MILPTSDDRVRTTFGAAGRSRRFARAAVRAVFVRLIDAVVAETLDRRTVMERVMARLRQGTQQPGDADHGAFQ
jgi:hypothetical protein